MAWTVLLEELVSSNALHHLSELNVPQALVGNITRDGSAAVCSTSTPSSWAADHGEKQELHNCGVFCQMAQDSLGMGSLHASQSQDTFASLLHGSGSRWLFVVEFPRLNLFRAINVAKTPGK